MNSRRTRNTIIGVVILLLLTVNLSLGFLLTRQASEAMITLIQNRMLDISNTAAAMIDGDDLASLTADDKDSEAYQSVLSTLTYFQDNIDLKYIYCVKDMGNKQFVFSADPTVDDPGEFGTPVVYTDALYQASLGTPAVDNVPYEDAWGRFRTATPSSHVRIRCEICSSYHSALKSTATIPPTLPSEVNTGL